MNVADEFRHSYFSQVLRDKAAKQNINLGWSSWLIKIFPRTETYLVIFSEKVFRKLRHLYTSFSEVQLFGKDLQLLKDWTKN